MEQTLDAYLLRLIPFNRGRAQGWIESKLDRKARRDAEPCRAVTPDVFNDPRYYGKKEPKNDD